MQTVARGGEKGGEWRAVATLAFLYLLAVALVPPVGNFPLNDDWSYAAATKQFLETGRLQFQPWTSVSLLLQLLWGAAACRLAGFSFEVLRVTTLVASWLGAVGCYFLFRLWVQERKHALLCALLVVANPLYFSLSYTFMTDVPFVAALVWAAFFYARGFRQERDSDLFVGGLCTTAAVLIRPYGILVAGAASLFGLTRPGPLRHRLLGAGAALVTPTLAFVAYHLWLALGPGLPAGYHARLAGLSLSTVPLAALDYGFRTAEYFGLFLLPLTLACRRQPGRKRFRVEIGCFVLLAAGVAVVYWREGGLMFYLTNVLYDLGAGALTLRDTLFLKLPAPWGVGLALRVPLTVAATLGGTLLAGSLVRISSVRRDPARQFILLTACVFFLFFLCLSRYYLDRHLLILLPLVTVGVVAEGQGIRRWLLGLGVAVMALFSLAATHDYLAWNAARWKALEAVMVDEQVTPEEIDGGFEFNAWFLAGRLGTVPTDEEVRPANPRERKSWWWVVDDRFVASFRPLPGYVAHSVATFRRLVPWGRGQVLILERD